MVHLFTYYNRHYSNLIPLVNFICLFTNSSRKLDQYFVNTLTFLEAIEYIADLSKVVE